MSDDQFDVGAPDTGRAVETVSEVAKEATALATYIGDLEGQLAEARSALHALRSSVLPGLMLDAGVESLTVEGWSVTLKNDVSGRWPSEEKARSKAVKYLEKLGHDGLLKVKLEASFGRSEYELAKDIAGRISNQCDVKLTETVHHQTLLSFARKRLESGESLSLEKLGLTMYQMANVRKGK